MRVAVVHNLPPGGARRRLASQLAHLEADVVEICLATATPIRPDAVIVPVQQRAPERARILRPPLRYLDLSGLIAAWRRAATEIEASGADAVFANPCRYLQAPAALLRCTAPSLYFCDEPRRVDSEENGRASRNRWTRLVYAPLYRRMRACDRAATARATQLATNSRYTAGEIARVYGREATVLRLGVAESLLQAETASRDGGFVLSVGMLLPTKGHDLVLRSVAKARSRRSVVVVAPRPGRAESIRLQSLARELGIELTINVGISDAELGRLYSAAHVTVYLAQREPLGLVSLEAQACGSPVIVAAEGGLPETVIDGVTGWSAPRDAQAVSVLLDRLEDSPLRERLSAAAVEHAKTWSWASSGRHVTEMLEELRSGQPHEVTAPASA
jgi:glycosyltransferase involved in cell wall biosynthesis